MRKQLLGLFIPIILLSAGCSSNEQQESVSIIEDAVNETTVYDSMSMQAMIDLGLQIDKGDNAEINVRHSNENLWIDPVSLADFTETYFSTDTPGFTINVVDDNNTSMYSVSFPSEFWLSEDPVDIGATYGVDKNSNAEISFVNECDADYNVRISVYGLKENTDYTVRLAGGSKIQKSPSTDLGSITFSDSGLESYIITHGSSIVWALIIALIVCIILMAIGWQLIKRSRNIQKHKRRRKRRVQNDED